MFTKDYCNFLDISRSNSAIVMVMTSKMWIIWWLLSVSTVASDVQQIWESESEWVPGVYPLSTVRLGKGIGLRLNLLCVKLHEGEGRIPGYWDESRAGTGIALTTAETEEQIRFILTGHFVTLLNDIFTSVTVTVNIWHMAAHDKHLMKVLTGGREHH